MKRTYLIWVFIALLILIGGAFLSAYLFTNSVIPGIVWWVACFIMNLIGHRGMYRDMGETIETKIGIFFVELLFAPIYLIIEIIIRLIYKN